MLFDDFAVGESAPKPYPPQAEVKMVWDEAHPVTTNPLVAKWLREERGLDPSLVNRLDLARALQPDQALPAWAGFAASEHQAARSWIESGHLMIVPLIDSRGVIRSLVARHTKKIKAKSVGALGFGRKGLLFGGAFESMLAAQLSATAKPSESVARWIFLEGEMNWMTWMLRLSQGASLTEMSAVLGMFGGGFDAAWGQLVTRSRAPVYLRHDPDGGGDKIANAVGSILWRQGHKNLWRTPHHEADDNQLHVSGRLHDDPTAGAAPFIPQDRDGVPLPELPPVAPTAPLTPAQVQAARPTTATEKRQAAKSRPLPRNERLDRRRRNYVSAAIRKGAARVLASGSKNHNNTLFAEAANAARFQHTPYLSVNEFRDAFFRVGKAVGQTPAEIQSTLLSAWNAARLDPARIELPEDKDLEVEVPGEGEMPGPSWESLGVTVDLDGVVVEFSAAQEQEWDDVLAAPAPTMTPAPAPKLDTSFDVAQLERLAIEQELAARDMAALMGAPVRTVEVTPEIAAMVDLALDGIATHCQDIYASGDELVRVVVGRDRVPVMCAVPLDAVIEAAATSTRWVRIKNNRAGDPIETHVEPPKQVLKSLMARTTFGAVHELNCIVRHATLSADGELLTIPGYHKEHKMLIFPRVDGERIDLVDSDCTPENARAALALLVDLFQDFNFESEAHRAAAFSLLFTLLVRQNLDTVPFFALDASTPGTGKGTVFQVVQAIATGNPSLSSWAPTEDADAEGKRLVSLGLEGRSGLCLFDNIKSGASLGNAVLDAALTNGFVSGRLLQLNKTATVKLSVTFAATGNNIRLSGDLHRRTLFMKLVALLTKRTKWTYPLIAQYAATHRLKYLRAALLIMRAFVLHGRLPSDDTWRPIEGVSGAEPTPYASFEAWSKMCRDPLVWLGMPDPVAGTKGAGASADLTTANFTALLEATFKITKQTPITPYRLQQLWEACKIGEGADDQDFCGALVSLGFVDDRRWKSGRAQSILSTYQDRALEGGYRLVALIPHRRWEIRKD